MVKMFHEHSNWPSSGTRNSSEQTFRRRFVRWRRSVLLHGTRPIYVVLLTIFILFLCLALWLLPSPPALSDALQQDIHIHSEFADQFESCYSTAPRQLIQFERPQLSEDMHPAHEFPKEKLDTFSTFFDKYLFEPHVDSVSDLRDSTRALVNDIHSLLRISQQVLRQYMGDTSVVIRNYTVGYSHLNAQKGSRYILHLVSTSRTNKFRHVTIAIRRTFDGHCSISLRESVTAFFDNPVFVVAPYSKRPNRLEWFLDQFEKLHSEGVNARLILAHCNEDESDRDNMEKLVNKVKRTDHVQVSRVALTKNSAFSRAVCLREAIKAVPGNNVIFVSDIDMYIYPKMFDSCRLNAIQGSQVYFPVFYSLFPGQARIEKGSGYWRKSSYGMSCMYKSDFDAVAAYHEAEDRFVGWGGEDLVLRDAFVNHANYEVFRAVEPALRHKWHPKNCDRTLPSYQDCISIRFQQLGDPVFLGKVLMERDIDVQDIVAQHFDDDAASQSTLNSSSARPNDPQPPNTLNEMTEEMHVGARKTIADEQD